MSTPQKPANARALPLTPAHLQQAFLAVCQQRRHFPADADIWHLRRHWPARKSGLLAEIQSGDYQFSPQHRLCKTDGQVVHLWSAEDAVVIKLLSAWLQDRLSVSPACVHFKGHGGLAHRGPHPGQAGRLALFAKPMSRATTQPSTNTRSSIKTATRS